MVDNDSGNQPPNQPRLGDRVIGFLGNLPHRGSTPADPVKSRQEDHQDAAFEQEKKELEEARADFEQAIGGLFPTMDGISVQNLEWINPTDRHTIQVIVTPLYADRFPLLNSTEALYNILDKPRSGQGHTSYYGTISYETGEQGEHTFKKIGSIEVSPIDAKKRNKLPYQTEILGKATTILGTRPPAELRLPDQASLDNRA